MASQLAAGECRLDDCNTLSCFHTEVLCDFVFCIYRQSWLPSGLIKTPPKKKALDAKVDDTATANTTQGDHLEQFFSGRWSRSIFSGVRWVLLFVAAKLLHSSKDCSLLIIVRDKWWITFNIVCDSSVKQQIPFIGTAASLKWSITLIIDSIVFARRFKPHCILVTVVVSFGKAPNCPCLAWLGEWISAAGQRAACHRSHAV